MEANPSSDVLPIPAICGSVSAGLAAGMDSPCEIASTLERRTTVMRTGEEREREEWARQTLKQLEQIVEACRPIWAIDPAESGSIQGLTAAVGEAGNESPHIELPDYVEEREPHPIRNEVEVASQPGAETFLRFDERCDTSEDRRPGHVKPKENAGRYVSRASFPGLGATGDPEYLLKKGQNHSQTKQYVPLLIFAVVSLLGLIEWRASGNDRSPNPMDAFHLKSAPRTSSENPAVAGLVKEEVPAPPPAKTEMNTPDNPSTREGASPAPPSPSKPAAPLPVNTAATAGKPETPASLSKKPEPAKAKPPDAITPASGADASLSSGSFELRKGVQAGATAEGRTWLWHAMAKDGEAPVVLADMYAQGNGVTKNCEQAVLLLKAASKNANPHGRSKLGFMYATGQCVPRDRVEAYRLMHSALQVNPGSGWLEKNQETLWKEMSTGERQRASAYR